MSDYTFQKHMHNLEYILDILALVSIKPDSSWENGLYARIFNTRNTTQKKLVT